MGRITSGVGLITGVPIEDTVNKLIAISGRPRDLLVQRNDQLKKQQIALGELTAQVIGLQLAAGKLGDASLFSKQKVTSSDSSLISASVSGTPVRGTHRLTPVQPATAQQLVSTGVESADTPLGAGTFSFGFGGFVDPAIALSDLNGGAGVQRGKIRITDRAGDSAVIDLRFAKTIDDVVAAINSADGISVSASTDGDALQLHDHTGLTAADLQVQEVSGGRTAADLGLLAVNSQAGQSTVTGADVLRLHAGTSLGSLNGGLGVRIRDGEADLSITLKTGDTISLDVTADGVPGTIGDLVDAINAADSRITARISSDGDHLEIADNTSGSGTFSVGNASGSHLADDLGIAGSTSGATVTSRRLVGGLKTSLLANLNGNRGLGTLGQLAITNRNGVTTNVDLSSAETLDDVVQAINAAGAGVTASVNRSRSGLQLVDTTSGTGNLVVAGETAEKLGLTFDGAAASVNGTSLDVSTVGENTLLSSLNHGDGVRTGSFRITDSTGAVGAVNLAVSQPKTVGDLIDLINATNIGVEARINDTGDGILVTDTAGGTGELTIQDVGNGKAAADLKIAGSNAQSIDGRTSFQITLDADDTLEDLASKINDLNVDVRASLFHDGSGSAPLHLVLTSQIAGRAGELLVEGRASGLQFDEVSAARDALLLVGGTSNGGGVLVSSSSGEFTNAIDGLTVSVNGASTTSVSVTVEPSTDGIEAALSQFVDQYNKLQDKLDTLTSFDATTNAKGLLFGSNETLRVESDLSQFLSGLTPGTGPIRSLMSLGIDFTETGKLTFDRQQFRNAFANDSEAVEQFFTKTDTGWADRLDKVVESLAGEGTSLLIKRSETLSRRVDDNAQRIDFMNLRLDRQKELLLTQFYSVEKIVSQLQASSASLANLTSTTSLVNSQRR